MTGCYPKRVLPIPHVLFPVSEVGLATEETTVADLLHDAGYTTACIGKWHLGDQPPFLPTAQGFDSYYGIPYSNDMGPVADGARSNLGDPIPEPKRRPDGSIRSEFGETGVRGYGQPPLPMLENNRVAFRVGPTQQQETVAGYTERAPTLHELNLKFQRATIYTDTTLNYADQGNPGLRKEEQLVASATVEYGSLDNNLRLSVTTGSIKNAIDWYNRQLVGEEGLSYTLFAPRNDEITFTDISLHQKIKLRDWLRLRSGGAYHIVDYRLLETKPYQPDYQVFSGLELHLYWPQKIMDLFAYGEITYVSEYEGYSVRGLGHELIGNVKLSFRIKNFRFHYVIQNILSTEYEPRENMINPGRYIYYGLTWNFFN